MLKGADHGEIVRAVRAVAGGEAIFSPAIASRMAEYFTSLRAPVPELFPA